MSIFMKRYQKGNINIYVGIYGCYLTHEDHKVVRKLWLQYFNILLAECRIHIAKYQKMADQIFNSFQSVVVTLV